MKKKIYKEIFIGTGIGVILAAIFIFFKFDNQIVRAGQAVTIPEIARNIPVPTIPLTEKSTPDEVIALMLNSHNQWENLEANAITTSNNTNWQTNIQIGQYGKGRGYFGPVGLEPVFSWKSDGNTLWKIDQANKRYEKITLPEDIKTLDTYGPNRLPFSPEGQSFIIEHPLEGIFPSMLSQFIFPHGLAQFMQQNGQVTVTGTDQIADRQAIVLQFQVFDNGGNLVKKHQYWIDVYTGIILQSQIYSEVSGWNEWDEQTTITYIDYAVKFSADTFEFIPAVDLYSTTK